MEKPGSDKTCQICNSNSSRYTCPRCSVPYCSMDCYKSTAHVNCSEEFYKEWVETEMKSQPDDPEQRRKMTEILKRVHEQEFNTPFDELGGDIEEPYDQLDSDDDEEVPDLEDRIRDIDLDNADELWGVLTDAERQEFEAILRNGDEEKLLPQWKPWWSHEYDQKLIREVNDDQDTKLAENCPKILEVAHIPAVEKASPAVRFNLLNVLHSYVLTVCHYDGDHQKSPTEAVSMFLQLCDNISDNKVFEDKKSALQEVTEKARDYQLLSGNEGDVMLNYLHQILQGPSREQQTFYISAALSDLHELFNRAKKELSKDKANCANPLFTKRFRAHIDEQYINLSKKSIPLYLKKIEYYLAWVGKFGDRMCQFNKT